MMQPSNPSSSKSTEDSDSFNKLSGVENVEKDEMEGNSIETILYEREDQDQDANESTDSVSQEIWIPPTPLNITSHQHEKFIEKSIHGFKEWEQTDRPEEKLSVLFDELKVILESDEYDDSLTKYLQESNPDYLKIIEKRKKDLLKEDHGIVVAGETSAGKSTLINKLLQKRIFKGRNRESTSTICKIRHSEDIKIITERTNGEKQTMLLPSTCNIETEEGQKLLRDTLKNLTDMTSSRDSKNFRSVDVGFPIHFLKGNTIIVDTPGIGGSGEVTKKLMKYLPNAVSFIFVIDVGSAGGMQKDRLPEILRSIIHLQLEDEMPCFDPREAIFITNKWDTIARDGNSSEDSSEDDEETKTWRELKKDIKSIWPSVKDENIFKMSLKHVSSKKTNASTVEFKNFRKCLKKVILGNENIRLSQHLRFLHEFLKNILKGIDYGLALGKRSEEEQRALTEKHQAKIKELKIKCKEEGRKLREDINNIIEKEAQDAHDYMSTDLGKDRILNPPGHPSLLEIIYLPNTFPDNIKVRVEIYIRNVLQSEKIQEKFLALKERALALHQEISSEISEMENDWIENSEEAHDENVEEVSTGRYVAGVIATSPIWIPLLAVVIGLTIATLGVGIAASPIIAPIIAIFGRKERRRKIIDEEYETYRSAIRSTICNHLEDIYGAIFEKFIKKITNQILPRKIQSLEKMIQELSENRQRILNKQTTLQRLSRKIRCIQDRKLEIQMITQSIELD